MPEHQVVRNLNRKISRESLLEIIQLLGIQDQAWIDILEGKLRRLHSDALQVEYWAAAGSDRSAQIKWLRALRKYVAKVDQHLEHCNELTQMTLGHALAPNLTRMLGREGMAAVYPPANQFLNLDPRERSQSRGQRDDRSKRGSSPRSESDPASERFAHDHVVELVRGMLRGLDEPLAWVLDAEKLSPRAKGGPVPDPRRIFVIRECAKIFETIGKTPTAKENGAFVVFCDGVLGLLGLPKAGVREAIIRALA